MRKPMRSFEVRRKTAPWQKGRWGFRTDGLDARHRELLERNSEMGSWDVADVSCAFILRDAEVTLKLGKRLAFHTTDGENFTLDRTEKPEELVSWKCAYCTKAILSRIGISSAANLTCRRCVDRAKEDEGPLIESSVDFLDKSKGIMIRRKRYILRYIKKNRKG